MVKSFSSISNLNDLSEYRLSGAAVSVRILCNEDQVSSIDSNRDGRPEELNFNIQFVSNPELI